MLKAVLVDDEGDGLRKLEYLLKDYYFIEITGMFTNPMEAIKKIDELNPQVIFMDIKCLN